MLSVLTNFPGYVLLLAGSMKLVTLWSHDIYFQHWSTILVIFALSLLELILGCLLFANSQRLTVLISSSFLFICFVIISGWKFFSGVEDCGCFGRFSTHPSISLTVSLVAILVLFERINRINQLNSFKFASHNVSRVFISVCFLLSMSFFIGQGSHWIEGKKSFGNDIRPGDLVTISVKQWQGKYFPLHDYILGSNEYLQGTWTVIFYSKDCPKCVRRLEELDHSLTGNLAIIEIPPWGLDQPISSDNRFPTRLWLRLSGDYRWLIEPATTLTLVDGYVKSLK